MAENLYNAVYNPDVLSCIANLSNDEVFTPPEVANAMLDQLPQALFRDPNAKFLDPACKSGVFLREIAKRLLTGLEEEIPDLQERVDHIFQKQLYGIAITELTSHLARRSVYCSKDPTSEYSVSRFPKSKEGVQGNIRFKNVQHSWRDGKCVFCGASEKEYGGKTREGLESHAYELIHTTKPEEIWTMKFDVIISNPPYQISTGGSKAQAIPLYHKFVEQAQKLQPRYISMIIPSRWFSGGFGLDGFRKSMIEDKRIREIHDFIEASECFGNGVEIKGGVCYFLWDRDSQGKCRVVTHEGGQISEAIRYMKESGVDSFIRRNQGVSIYHKVKIKDEKSMMEIVSSQKPFGIGTAFHGKETPMKNDILLYENGGIGYIGIEEIQKGLDIVQQYKVLLSAGYNGGDSFPHQILGRPIVAAPNSACTETYIVIGAFDSEEYANNLKSYISTKFFRFMVMLLKNTQHALKKVYQLVPQQDFSKPWTDEELYAKYNLTQEEIDFIESMIKPMEIGGDE